MAQTPSRVLIHWIAEYLSEGAVSGYSLLDKSRFGQAVQKRSHQPHGNCRPIVVKDLSCCNLLFMPVLLELRQSGAA